MDMKNSIRMAVLALTIAYGLTASHSAKADTITDPDLIRQAQDILYNLNFDVGEVNGQVTEATRQAIIAYQRIKGVEQTGILTVELLLELRDEKIPDSWGAIAASVDSTWGATWGYSNRAEAERDAKSECTKRTETQCNVVAFYGDSCLALYHWDGKEKHGYTMREGA
jgi:peptidoglycan hydrolase-like protein with peptidoglycan-binding domain